ncbi:hypothetical protein FKP32DRAFT_64040 [Trametes sanguinea]|nr:hypothetical protein FKP32DRAFT_64040 [Trametes sanguinea]
MQTQERSPDETNRECRHPLPPVGLVTGTGRDPAHQQSKSGHTPTATLLALGYGAGETGGRIVDFDCDGCQVATLRRFHYSKLLLQAGINSKSCG